VSGVTLDCGYQVGNQFRSPLELGRDAGPGFLSAGPGLNQTVVQPERQDDEN
jgi:hypothetical protein